MSIERELFDLLDIKGLENISNLIRDAIINFSKMKGLDTKKLLKDIIEAIEEMDMSENAKEALIARAKKDFGGETEESKENSNKKQADSFKEKLNVVFEQLYRIHKRQTKIDEHIELLKDMIHGMYFNINEKFERIENRIDFLFKKFNLED